MAFGGGFSFGNNNNNNNAGNQNTGFGGFGSTSNNTGFGASTNTGFGASTSGTNPFGGSTSTFGANNTGFGSNANNASTSLFGGNKPATSNPFGSSTGTTSLFGNNNNTTPAAGGFGSGGFGTTASTSGFGTANNNNNNNTTTTAGGGFAFGSPAAKPAFGASTTTPLFGQGGAGTTGGFGGTGAFGSPGTGTALNQPVGQSDGTASTPFAPTSEKEPNGVTNSYQSITFQQPYQKYSFEELRLADYNAGRRFGNGSGQPGAFGANAFGGFGTNNTGGFGATNTTSNPFGATTSAATPFGSNTATSGFGGGTSLFNNATNKPGGLFGTTTTSASTTGGLFGTSNNTTTTGFGANNNTSGGLFGNNNQAKPSGGLFSGTTGTTNNAFSFGNNNTATTNTGGGLFGGTNNNNNNTGGGLFSGNNQQSTTGGLFSNNNNTQGTSLFGNKPTTGFGAQTTQAQSGGLFSTANNNTGTSGGLFSNNNNTTNTSGGLFGTNNNTSGGLFTNTTNTANQTGQKSLFGNGFGAASTTNNTGGGLFGNASTTNNQTSGGLFSNNTNNASGGFNFGNANANKPTTSLFGNASTSQQGGGLFGSTSNNTSNPFGASQTNQQSTNQQQDGVKHASLLDPNPYGQSSIWTGLPQPTPENAKPVFTPLTATQKMKESMMKPPPSLRLNQSRYMTPPRRNGFGLSYSTYGTPSSAASTPGGAGLSGSMYGSRGFSGGSFGRSFNKSASVQNLRSQFTSDNDDIWKPGAFASTHRNSSGSIKRLTIDRTIRNDLFSRPTVPALPAPAEQSRGPTPGGGSSGATQQHEDTQQDTANKLKKRVSFENGPAGGTQHNQLNGETGALVRVDSDESQQGNETSRQHTRSSGTDSQHRGKDLDIVPEDRESHHTSSRPQPEMHTKADPKSADPQPGDYWMKPSRAEITKLPRDQAQKFKNFQVGRVGCGKVTFNGTVDLLALPLDELYDTIVEIRLRSITVYPETSSKPPVGKGLNVPSTLEIDNSWPRSRGQPTSATGGHVYDKHIQRLKQISGTDFISYEASTGVWKFRVPHYTRYGLDYDDDDDMSALTSPPNTIGKSDMDVDDVLSEDDNDNEDDTFAFRHKIVPGGFGRQSAIDYDPKPAADQSVESDDASENSVYSDEEMSDEEPSMVGAYPETATDVPGSPSKTILKASQFGASINPLLDLDGDWADQLQRTISPRKQDRDMLRETQSKVLLDRAYSPIKPKPTEKKDFRTSIDIMNSLFGLANERGNNGRKQGKAAEPEFEFPYAKRAKTFNSNPDDMPEAEQKWHQSFKSQFTGLGDLIYKRTAANKRPSQGDYTEEVLAEDQGTSVIKSSQRSDIQPARIENAITLSDTYLKDHIPFAEQKQLPFSDLAKHLTQPGSDGEVDVLDLLHLLFDDYEDEFTSGLPNDIKTQFQSQIRKDRLTQFLSSRISKKVSSKITTIDKENSTAAAVLKLTVKDIKGACDSLEKAKNYKCMILVSQLANAGASFQDDIRAQIDAWREQRVLSEINEDIRAIYELCSGNTTICAGKGGNNVPVEDKARTFGIADEYNLDWLQCFALGLWYGRDEKNHASSDGVVSIETAVLEFEKRCERKEESQLPGNDPLWVVLRLYAAVQLGDKIEMPVFPTALDSLITAWDSRKTLVLHLSIITNIEEAAIDPEAEEQLVGTVAYQLSSKGDIAGAAYALLHLHNSKKRETMLRSLLDRFAGQLPDPPSSTTSETTTQLQPTDSSTPKPAPPTISTDLWTILTTQLKIPPSWLYQSKALHARAVFGTNPSLELHYLVSAKLWDEAHDCFTHRVAPGIVVDDDIEHLNATVDLFEDDVAEKIAGWEMGGGVYADYGLMCVAKGELNQDAVEGLRGRLVELGRRFKSSSSGMGDGNEGGRKEINLGKLPVEELEQRVAVQEMSRVVAEKFVGNKKLILELPLTSDVRLVHTMALAGEYYKGVVGGVEES